MHILINIILIVKFPNMRFQTTSRLEVSKAVVTFMFQAHKMSLYVHPHVTFLFNFFMTLRTTPQDGCITLGHRFIHQTLQLGIKFCKKISSQGQTQKTVSKHPSELNHLISATTHVELCFSPHLCFHHSQEPAGAHCRHSPDHPRSRRSLRTPRNSRHPSRPQLQPGLEAPS